MNRLILIFLLMVSCSGDQPDYSWFQGEWISDAEASLAINPEYAALDAETLQTIRDAYGKIKWTVRENTMKFVDDRYNLDIEFEVAFSAVPIDSERFQMEMPDEIHIIWKTDTGFCKVLSSDYLSEMGIEGDNLGLECFKPAGT